MQPKDKSTMDEAELSSSKNQFNNHKSLKSSFFEKIHLTQADIFDFLVRSVFIVFVSAFFLVAAIYYGLINP